MKKSFRILKFKKDRPVFEVKNISKNYNGRPILKNLSLKVYPGEIVGLLGPNGAGKSTLFNIAIGADTADSGNIYINGKSITQIPIHLRSKLGLGYMPQTRCLFDTLSCYNNLVHLRSLKAGVLSGGEAKRLSLARLMISNPKIVLLDESFSNVDPIQVQEMQKYIMKIQSQNVACILTEHALENLFNTTDRNYLINEGNIIAEGTKRELLNNSEAIKNYFGTNFTNK